MRWILDDGPFEHLARIVEDEDTTLWQADILLVAATTAAAAAPTRQALLDLRVDGKPVVATFEICLGSGDPAEKVLIELRPDTTSTVDLAEHESIAWAQVHGLDTVFVCADRRVQRSPLLPSWEESGWPTHSMSG